MTAQVSQGAFEVALVDDGNSRINQTAIIVAYAFQPPNIDSIVNQAAIIIAARRYPINAVAPIDCATMLANIGCCNSVPLFTREA